MIPERKEKATLPNCFIGPDIPRFCSDRRWMKDDRKEGEKRGR